MKNRLLFLSVLSALILLGGCSKEPFTFEGTKWTRITDSFGGLHYHHYNLVFSTGDEVILELCPSSGDPERTIKGTYQRKTPQEVVLSGLEWEEGSDNSYTFLTAYPSEKNKNVLWVSVRNKTGGTFSISFNSQ